MNGKGIYYAIVALLGVITVLLKLPWIFVVFLIYLYVLSFYKTFTSKQIIFVCIIFTLFLVIGEVAEKANKTSIHTGQTNFHLVFHDWKMDGDKLQIVAKEKRANEKIIIEYQIKSINEKNILRNSNLYGKQCVLTGKLETPSQARNPNAFDYRHYLSTKQIYWVLTSDQFPLHSCSPETKSIFTFLPLLRYKGVTSITNYFPEPTATLAVALIFGDRNAMPSDLITAYQKTGLVHILAISGLHISLLTGLIFLIGVRLGVVREDMVTALLLALPCYAVITGASPSVVRSVITTMLLLCSLKFTSRVILPLDGLSIAFMLMLIVSPYDIFDIGFQLSFACSAALLLSTTLLLRFKHLLMQMLVVSFISQIASLPILLWNFFEFSLISLPANVLFVPFFSTFLLPMLFFLFLIPPSLKFLVYPIVLFVNDTISLINRWIIWLSKLSFPLMILGRPEGWMIVCFVFLFFLFFKNWDKDKNRRNILFSTFLLLTPFLLQVSITKWSPVGEITFIDVGQGDAILIKFPLNKGTYLIDTGGSIPFAKEEWQVKNNQFEVGKDVVVPFLKSRGITSIDKLILTHGDFDHMGEAVTIMNELQVKEILFPKNKLLTKLESETIKIANRKNVKITFLAEGDMWESGNYIFRVFSPSIKQKGDGSNNDSIAILADIGRLTWFFAGDLEEEGEKNVVRRQSGIKIDVLKVAHHGSKTSTTEELLTAFSPRLAIISVGRDNLYHHPHQEVLTRLENKNILILRTDKNGAITYFFTGKGGTFSTMIP